MNKPTNAYELCERVCEAIEHAPQNYFQGSFACSTDAIEDDDGNPIASAEACGTAFCRAGWMCAIMDDKVNRTPREWMRMDMYRPAVNLFLEAGINSNEIEELFDGTSNISVQYGDPAYTRQGIAGMKRFMRRNKAKLLAQSTKGWKNVESGW